MPSDIRCISESDLPKNVCSIGRWWWAWFPHTWRNHPAWSPHPCRTSHQAPFLLSNTHTKFIFHTNSSSCFDQLFGLTELPRNTIGILDTGARRLPYNQVAHWVLQCMHWNIFIQLTVCMPECLLACNSFTFSSYWFTPFGQHDQIIEFMGFLVPAISNGVYSKKVWRQDRWCLYRWNSWLKATWTGFLPAITHWQLRLINKEEVSDRVWPAWYAALRTFILTWENPADCVVEYCLLFVYG